MLSRFPLTDDRHIRLPQPEANGAIYNAFYLHRHLTGVTATLGPAHSLRIVNAHLEAFDDKNRLEHARQATTLMQDAGPLSLLLGDMNCTPPEAKVRRAFEDEPETDMSSDNTIGLLRGFPASRRSSPRTSMQPMSVRGSPSPRTSPTDAWTTSSTARA